MLIMIYLHSLSLFGSWFASGPQIAVFIVMVLSLIFIIIYSYFFYQRRQKVQHSRLMKQKYEQYLNRLNLSSEELSYISRLAGFLESEDLRYHMLTDKRTFSNCADALEAKDKIPKALREGIEKKLNFPSKTVVSDFFSSEELPVGMPALLIFSNTDKTSAVIGENNRSSLTLKTKKPIPPVREGTPLSVYFHDNQKIFTINTTILEQKDNLVTISHSLLESQKRRAFKRKRVKLPVVIKHLDMNDTPLHSYITDISEGGASLENPEFTFNKHDRIILYYHIETEEGFQIRAEVLRLSAKGRLIHVKFLDRDLTLRSRIKTIVK